MFLEEFDWYSCPPLFFSLSLPPPLLQVWFQNRRAKWRKREKMLAATDVRFRTLASPHRDFIPQYSPVSPWNWPRQVNVSPTSQAAITPYTFGFSLPAPTPVYPAPTPYTTAWMQAQALQYSQMQQWMNSSSLRNPQIINTASSLIPQSTVVAVNE